MTDLTPGVNDSTDFVIQFFIQPCSDEEVRIAIDVDGSVQPLSAAQESALRARTIPAPEAIADDVWSLALPMPGEIVGYTLSVLFAPATRPAAILDPGWGSSQSLDYIVDFMREVGRNPDDLQTVYLTHAHPDHSGLATEIRARTGAEIVMHSAEQQSVLSEASQPAISLERLRSWGLNAHRASSLIDELRHASDQTMPTAQRLLEDGENVVAGDRTLRVVATAGHTPGHICLASSTEHMFYGGDLVLPTVFPGIGLGSDTETNPLADYLNSLERSAEFDSYTVVPGHGYRFRGLGRRRADAAEYMLRRAREVAAVAAMDRSSSVASIASRLTWRAGWERLEGSVMLAPALRQTALYLDFADRGGLDGPADLTDVR